MFFFGVPLAWKKQAYVSLGWILSSSISSEASEALKDNKTTLKFPSFNFFFNAKTTDFSTEQKTEYDTQFTCMSG